MAVGSLIVWGISGPFFGFSDTWQLVINTGTAIVTFLMVFLIQNTQNRDSEALHVKLDELLRANKGAQNALLDLEELEENELDRIRADYKALAQKGPRGNPSPYHKVLPQNMRGGPFGPPSMDQNQRCYYQGLGTTT